MRWLASATFAVTGTVTTASQKVLSVDFDSATMPNLRALVAIADNGALTIEMSHGLFGLETSDRMILTSGPGSVETGHTYGLDAEDTPNFGLNYWGTRKNDVENYTVIFPSALTTYSNFAVKILKWDPATRQLEATLDAAGRDDRGQSIQINESISLSAEGDPCDITLVDCQAKFY